MTISSNQFLTREEMLINANYIMGFLLDLGWSKESIAGMLGNMETESTINPGLWQNRDQGNMNLGFGLVQWTPASKYTNWADDNGYEWGDINGQLARLDYEIANGIQWISSSAYPLSFAEFKTSTQSPEYLAQAFLINYERPANQNQPARSTQARYWFENTTGEGGGGGGRPLFPTVAGLPITSPYGWRVHPVTGERTFHGAIDIGGQGSTHPIFATQNGEVYRNIYTDSGGWMVYIRHTGDPYFSRYIHLDSQSPIAVGTTVTKGQEIGTMGNTGVGTGIHLDFAIAINEDGWSVEETTIDPEIYLQMDFGGGGGGETPSNENNKIIELLLSNALNGWGR